MGSVQRRKGCNGKNKALHRGIKPKHYGRDHDQIHDDINQK